MGDLETGLLEWAGRQSEWQRDMLRRLAGGEVLTAADLRAYADEAYRGELAKGAAWFKKQELPDQLESTPLDATHLASTVVGGDPVQLTRVTHLEGVNDLAPGATLEFKATGLTVVAGSNGTGKSGYTRIFKQVAATRASEQVLPNAFNPAVDPKAVLTYQIGGSSPATDLTWEGGAQKKESPLQRVRVFDSGSANVHLSGATEVAYVPASLQVLGSYTSALLQVAELLASDARDERLGDRAWPELQYGAGLTMFEALGTPEGLTMLADIKALTEDEQKELDGLPARISELTTSDPAARAVQARQRAGQLRTLANSLELIAKKLTLEAVSESRRIRADLDTALEAVKDAQALFDDADVLPRTGSEKWQAMWNAAQEFVEDDEHDHEYLQELEQCPLCVQPLDQEGRRRFELFAEFMGNEAQATVAAAKKSRDSDIESLKTMPLKNLVTQDLVDLVATYDEAVGDSLLPLVGNATSWRDALVAVTDTGDKELPSLAAMSETFGDTVRSLRRAVDSEESSAKDLEESDSSAQAVAQLRVRDEYLRLRRDIDGARAAIGEQHDRTIRASRYDAAKSTCATSSASRKNSELSQGYVEKVCAQFETEAIALGLRRVPVELAFDRTARGVSYVKVFLKGAPQIPVASVLSEGEQRVTAIAGFFADLTESGDQSALIFDDPVSSLDQEFRVKVAQRLLEEADKRQVLVFTHDFAFVQYLYEEKALRDKARLAAGSEKTADLDYLHIARTPDGAGSVTDAQVWRHVSVKERLGRLKVRRQAAAVLYRSGDMAAYEKEVRDIVGGLRETWEVFVEQDLLNGVVRRHERSVQTQRLSKLIDLKNTDVATVELGMSVESRYMTGHAAPTTDGSGPQDPDWVLSEIQWLENYRKEVIARR